MTDYKSQLPGVPQIGGMLGLTREQVQAVNDNPARQFFGDKAVAMGLATREQVNAALLGQSGRIADAALQDVSHIARTGQGLNYPEFLNRPNYGNNGVNTVANPTRIDAASAAANLARNMTIIANQKPELASELLPFVNEARNVTLGAMNGRASAVNLELATHGMRVAVERSGIAPTDRSGQPVNLDAYLAEATRQIEQGARQPSLAPEQTPPVVERPNVPSERGNTPLRQ